MPSKLIRNLVSALLVVVVSAGMAAQAKQPAGCDEQIDESIVVTTEKVNGITYLKANIVTPAPVPRVWNSILEEPNHDKHLRSKRIISKQNATTILEEEFEGVPLVGHTMAVVQAEEVPCTSLTYKLLKSNHFKRLDATWTIARCHQSNNTIVELRCHVETKVYCPQVMLHTIVASRLKRRLTFVKNYSEQPNDGTIAFTQQPGKN
jgi:hypothetical protein